MATPLEGEETPEAPGILGGDAQPQASLGVLVPGPAPIPSPHTYNNIHVHGYCCISMHLCGISQVGDAGL